VSITGNAIRSWEHIPGVQPEVMVDEFEDAERAVKARLPARATRSVSLRAGGRGRTFGVLTASYTARRSVELLGSGTGSHRGYRPDGDAPGRLPRRP
jgi:hypothetical protein